MRIDRPAPVAPWLALPDVERPPLPHKDIMSNFPTLPSSLFELRRTSRAGALAVGDCSDKAPGKKRHNVILCGASGKSVGASCRGQPGRVSRVAVRKIPVFHSDSVPTGRDFAASSKPPRPGAWSFEQLISDAYLFSRLAARSRVPLCATGYDLASRAASLHASPNGGLPPTTCAAVAPPRRAWPRA